MYNFISSCPSCGGELHISTLQCGSCGLEIKKDFEVSVLISFQMSKSLFYYLFEESRKS